MATANPITSKTAWAYLRVSTKRQVKKDLDPDGLSIPVQKNACTNKAADLGAEIAEADYFIDRGESAKTADRKALKQMLARLQDGPAPNYIIVLKLNRLIRQVEDFITLKKAARAAGTHLVSVFENIDETPAGQLMAHIQAAVAEYDNANLAHGVKLGMARKAEVGGTPGLAPIGYFNKAEILSDNRIAKIVIIDPDRAPLIILGFELYATGDYTLNQIIDELTLRGLRNRNGKPITPGQMSRILHNAYYVGDIVFHGVVYRGRHKPIVSRQTFDRVQQVLVAHNLAGEKERVHQHYLKGTVYCARCESRLIFTLAKGQYPYFVCHGRHKGQGCDLPYLSVDQVEASVEREWNGERIDPEDATALRDDLRRYLYDAGSDRHHEVARLKHRLGVC